MAYLSKEAENDAKKQEEPESGHYDGHDQSGSNV
jgi:hypothetical protein